MLRPFAAIFRKIIGAGRNHGPVSFHYRYSSDPVEKRQQIWSNLQTGILFEDVQVFIPWTTPYKDLDKFKQSRKKEADRTDWFLGKHVILDGMVCYVEVEQKRDQPNDTSFNRIRENLGTAVGGNERFLAVVAHLTRLLGPPTHSDVEKPRNYTVGEATWIHGKVEITIYGVEIFNIHYGLRIGLVEGLEAP